MAKKSEKPTNCAECNKFLSRVSYYYRNGKCFCNKRCFKLNAVKVEEAKAKAEAEEAAKVKAEEEAKNKEAEAAVSAAE